MEILVKMRLMKLLSAARLTPSRFSRFSRSAHTHMATPIPQHAHRIYLIRHGEVIPPGGVHGVFYGAMDVELSPLGKQEAAAAGDFMKSELASLGGGNLDSDSVNIYSSPLKRAVFGAECVKSSLGGATGPITLVDGFKELSRGAWAGKRVDEIGEEAFEAFHIAMSPAEGAERTPEGGESLFDIRDRVLEGYETVKKRGTPSSVSIIVSHLWVTRSIVADCLNVGTDDLRSISIDTASISAIDIGVKEDGTQTQTLVFKGLKPDVGLEKSVDAAN